MRTASDSFIYSCLKSPRKSYLDLARRTDMKDALHRVRARIIDANPLPVYQRRALTPGKIQQAAIFMYTKETELHNQAL